MGGQRLGHRKQRCRVETGNGDKEAVKGALRYQLPSTRSPVTASAAVPGEQINDGEAVAVGLVGMGVGQRWAGDAAEAEGSRLSPAAERQPRSLCVAAMGLSSPPSLRGWE